MQPNEERKEINVKTEEGFKRLGESTALRYQRIDQIEKQQHKFSPEGLA